MEGSDLNRVEGRREIEEDAERGLNLIAGVLGQGKKLNDKQRQAIELLRIAVNKSKAKSNLGSLIEQLGNNQSQAVQDAIAAVRQALG